MRWPKYWSFSFSVSPPNEYSGLISFKTNWFDLLAVQGTLKSLLQNHSSKASTLRRSAFFFFLHDSIHVSMPFSQIIPPSLSHPHMTTGKTIALTRSYEGFPGGSDGKLSACSAGGPGLIPGLGRSPGEGDGNPLQYSCLENSMDG